MKHTITVTIEIPQKHPPLLRMCEHPHEVAMERHGMADGLARVKAFIEREGVVSELVQLLWTYPDHEAEELFRHLRDTFWTEDPATPFPKETE